MKGFIDVQYGEGSPEDMLWCLHCERTYSRKEARGEMCAYHGCDGAVFADGLKWESVRTDREDRYPAEPEKGKVYPLYE